MQVHRLKTDPEVFRATKSGAKTHEIRFNDRNFQIGDILHLGETVHTGEEMRAGKPLAFTGENLTRRVTHVLSGYGLMENWVILSVVPAELKDEMRSAVA